MGLFDLLRFKQPAIPDRLAVDFDSKPLLPNGATGLRLHEPVARGLQAIGSDDLVLEPMPPGMSYTEFREAHRGELLCDASILDAIVQLAGPAFVANRRKGNRILEKLFPNFSGQVFFLGTSFMTTWGCEGVPFLCVKTPLPALRYLCPSDHPVNHDLNASACFLAR